MSQVEIIGGRVGCKTPSHQYPLIHADIVSLAVSDSFREDQNVGGVGG